MRLSSSEGEQVSSRGALLRVGSILAARPEFRGRYEAARRTVRIFRQPSFYEISQRCNLRCEGCYYFEDAAHQPVPEEESLDAWDRFFESEARRGVSMVYFVGAEPALEQERLRIASRHLPHGNVGTNGTVRISPDIQFRISISLWASDSVTDRKLRGASAFQKAMKNYAGDPRAIAYYTMSAWNLDGVATAAEMCRDHGLPLTFNLFSPTTTYLEKLSRGQGNDKAFFRSSRQGDTPMLSAEGLARARGAVLDVMERFPETVLYSRAYNDWVTTPGPIYDLDEDGFAKGCGSRIKGFMNYYGPDIVRKYPKCCTPDLDCSQCRIMSGGWSTALTPAPHHLESEAGFENWLEMIEAVGRIFLYERPEPEPDVAGLSAPVMVA